MNKLEDDERQTILKLKPDYQTDENIHICTDD